MANIILLTEQIATTNSIGVTNDEEIFSGSMLDYWRKQQQHNRGKTRIDGRLTNRKN